MRIAPGQKITATELAAVLAPVIGGGFVPKCSATSDPTVFRLVLNVEATRAKKMTELGMRALTSLLIFPILIINVYHGHCLWHYTIRPIHLKLFRSKSAWRTRGRCRSLFANCSARLSWATSSSGIRWALC